MSDDQRPAGGPTGNGGPAGPLDGAAEWTDDQLDDALAMLYRVDGPSARALTDARSIMMGQIGSGADQHFPPVAVSTSGKDGSPGRRTVESAGAATAGMTGDVGMTGAIGGRSRWRRRALLAAAVAVVVSGALVLPTLHWGGSTPPASAAAQVLNQAADATTINAQDQTLEPGQYQYFETDAWYMASSSSASGDGPSTIKFAALTHSKTQRWTPADWSRTWLERRTDTGEKKWIIGSEAEAKKAGMDPAAGPSTEPDYRGPCQDYFQNVCTDPGSWQTPTKPWLAALPRDPDGLYRELAAAAKGHGTNDDAEMLVYATDALRQGLLPADVRATLYRAMARIPGIEVVDNTANLDGEVGVAFAIEDGIRRSETIIDPKTGDFIGEREVLPKALDGFPAGTVFGYTAVHTAVVDTLGQQPRPS